MAGINRYTVPIGVLYAKKIMAKKRLIRDLTPAAIPRLISSDRYFSSSFRSLRFNHEVKLLRKSFMELSRHAFRYVFSGLLINF